MLANNIIERSFKLELDDSRAHCIVRVSGWDEGFYHWRIVTLQAEVIQENSAVLNGQNSFSIALDNIIPGQYILSISDESNCTRHLKLVV